MVIQLDDIESVPIEYANLQATRWRVGPAVGAVKVGLSRSRIERSRRAIPVHQHATEEELFFVVAGSGVSWQDGRTYAVRTGTSPSTRSSASLTP